MLFLSPDFYFVFVTNVYSVLFNMCVCHLFINKESSREFRLTVDHSIHHILSLYSIVVCSCNALGQAFLQSLAVLLKNCSLIFQPASCHAENVIILL